MLQHSKTSHALTSASKALDFKCPSLCLWCEALWICLFLTSLQLPVPTPFPLLCNNQSAIKLANSDTSSSRSKHINIHYHFIHKKIEDSMFKTSWIPMAEMTTDIFMKPLPFPAFSKHHSALGVVLLPWFPLFFTFLLFPFFFLSFLPYLFFIWTRWGCIGYILSRLITCSCTVRLDSCFE